MNVKYILIIGDGMADYPVEEFNGKTPLQVAEHPNMDMIASRGLCGMMKTLSANMDTGSDAAFLAIFGYDPNKYFTGRGPLEAIAAGINLAEDEIAFRCNFITENEGFLIDYCAGHIETSDAEQLIDALKEEYEGKTGIQFHKGVSYRHILTLKGEKYSEQLEDMPPHDAIGRKISDILLKPGNEQALETANFLNKLMLDSTRTLSSHPINLERAKKKINKANMIWLWSPGKKPKLPSFQEKYNLKSSVISAVNLVKGIGLSADMKVINVPGATGYLNTDYEAKAGYALKSLSDHDFVIVHVEATDEAGHAGDFDLKVKAIEDLDRRLVGNILKKLAGDYVISVTTDHPTPVKLKTHTDDPVPFAIYSTVKNQSNGAKRFDEENAHTRDLHIDAIELIQFILLAGK